MAETSILGATGTRPPTPDDATKSEPTTNPPAARLDGAERTGDTGKTGDTVFVGQSTQWALNQSAAGAMLDEGEDEDEDAPPPRRQSLVIRVLPVFALFAVIVFSYLKMRAIDADEARDGGELRGDATTTATTTEASTGATVEDDSMVTGGVQVPELPARGTPVPAFLERTVERVRPGEEPTFIKLSEVVPQRRVTLVNLWATWCGPCKSELPELQAMFAEAGWGERVRFVSVQTQDGEDPSIAYRNFAATMPSSEYFLASIGATDNGLADALREAKLIQEQKLPISVVFDCRQEARLALVGGLSGDDLGKVRTQLDTLVAELDTPFCPRRAAPRPSSAESTPIREDAATKAGARCGDNRCERPQESCSSCRADCGCPGGETCRNGRCTKSVRGLK